MDDIPQPPEIQRDSLLYFEDGNLVLCGQHFAARYDALGEETHAAGRVAFKVHRSVLAMNSIPLGGILTIPPSADVEMFDGVPFVEMQDDSHALRELLNGMYSGTWL